MQTVTLDTGSRNVVNHEHRMLKDVQTRIRRRIRDRLDELGMTARELGRSVGHDDAWISGVLKGAHGIAWKDFDAVADKLNVAPSELVRHDDAVVRELTPSEMRLLRHYQDWPTTIRERWLTMLDYFASTAPDPDTAVILDRLRSLPKSARRPVLAWLLRLLEEGIPPEAVFGGVELGSGEESTESDTTRRDPKAGTPRASRKLAAGRRTRREPPKTDA